MSHPSSDPATTSVAAKLAGLTTPPPSHSQILEIGCATGHNLLPLAARWPDSRFTGIDIAGDAIREAREAAVAAGLDNITFLEADLATFEPAGTAYDFVIAHGIYSWVPAPVRQTLLDFCARHLSPAGVATISYNTLPGWSQRQAIVDLVRLLAKPLEKTIGADPVDILSYLAGINSGTSHHAAGFHEVVQDMLHKGDGILLFDDFGPTNFAVTFLDFIGHIGSSGLRYLGESQLSANFPVDLPPDGVEALKPLAHEPLLLQQTLDVLTNRTFRSSLLCRADAPVDPKLTTATAMHFAVRCPHVFERTVGGGGRLVDDEGTERGRFEHPLALAFFSTLAAHAPETVPMQEVLEGVAAIPEAGFDPTASLPPLANLILDAARQKLIELRAEPVRFDSRIPQYPKLNPLRQRTTQRGEALVDIYHVPCSFSKSKNTVLNAMDGSRNVEELAALAHVNNPTLDFRAWLAHLAARGMFV